VSACVQTVSQDIAEYALHRNALTFDCDVMQDQRFECAKLAALLADHRLPALFSDDVASDVKRDYPRGGQ